MPFKELDLASEMMKHRACPDLAAAMRHEIGRIVNDWEAAVRHALPGTRQLPSQGLRDRLPDILGEIADVLQSPSRKRATRLIEMSPEHGVARFDQQFDLRQLFEESVLLRPVILGSTEERLGRPIGGAENLLLNVAIDVTLQGAALAFLARNSDRLRAHAEAEMKHLAFLSHDMNNNLSAVVLHLRLLRERLVLSPGFAAEIDALDQAQHCITRTTEGMHRLLVHEKFRKQQPRPLFRPANLHELAVNVVAQYSAMAKTADIGLSVQVPRDAVVQSDYQLLGLVLQNFVHNALKYSTGGSVWIVGRHIDETDNERWVLSVSDEGPGIPPDQLQHIFDAFRQGDAQHPEGVGLGLAIAAEVAHLLGADLSVESRVGSGSRFDLTLPTAGIPSDAPPRTS